VKTENRSVFKKIRFGFWHFGSVFRLKTEPVASQIYNIWYMYNCIFILQWCFSRLILTLRKRTSTSSWFSRYWLLRQHLMGRLIWSRYALTSVFISQWATVINIETYILARLIGSVGYRLANQDVGGTSALDRGVNLQFDSDCNKYIKCSLISYRNIAYNFIYHAIDNDETEFLSGSQYGVNGRYLERITAHAPIDYILVPTTVCPETKTISVAATIFCCSDWSVNMRAKCKILVFPSLFIHVYFFCLFWLLAVRYQCI